MAVQTPEKARRVDESIEIADEAMDDTEAISFNSSPDDLNDSSKAPSQSHKRIKQAANAESPVLKSQEIFGAVKIKDGLFLGDQYSAQVSSCQLFESTNRFDVYLISYCHS